MAETEAAPRTDLSKYKLVRRAKSDKDELDKSDIRISSQGRMAMYISYAAKLLTGEGEEAARTITLKCTGVALGKAVTLAEIIKRRIKGLHQICNIGTTEVVDVYEPKSGEGENIEQKRNLSFIEITLSLDSLDSKDKGYQAPLPDDMVEEKDLDDLINPPKKEIEEGEEGEGKPKGKGKKGKGKRSRKGKGKGKKGKGKKEEKSEE